MAGYLARVRGVVVEPEHVVVCCAASQALTVLWHALRHQGGRRVAIEDPGWRWQRYTVEHAGLEAVPVRVDGDGMVVSELAAADVDAVVMTPAHHYPTGVVMTAERRGALIAWARERGALIVEDDYDVEYRFGRDPVASLQGLAPDLVAFVGTTSKTLAPALRLAWVVPPSHLINDVENVLLVTGVTPPTLDQMAMASFIEDAALERHLRAMRRRYRAKRDVLVAELGRQLPEVRVSGTAAGLHVLAWLPDGADEHATAMRARQSGVGVHELHRHCTTQAPSAPALLLGFALPTESELVTATRLLASALCLWPCWPGGSAGGQAHEVGVEVDAGLRAARAAVFVLVVLPGLVLDLAGEAALHQQHELERGAVDAGGQGWVAPVLRRGEQRGRRRHRAQVGEHGPHRLVRDQGVPGGSGGRGEHDRLGDQQVVVQNPEERGEQAAGRPCRPAWRR